MKKTNEPNKVQNLNSKPNFKDLHKLEKSFQII